MLTGLVDLAREGSSEKRRELLQQVSNLFLEGADTHSDRETVLFGEVLGRLLDDVNVMDRSELSQKVSEHHRTPRPLALKLASDVLSVAAPVLQNSPVLTDDDLVDIASRKGQDHMAAISRRATLSETVTDFLVERGDSTVLQTVARNLGARFSDQGFDTLADRAELDHLVADALSFRSDIPPIVATKIVALLNPVARQRLEYLLAQSADTVDSLLTDAKREMEASRRDQRRNRLETKVLVAEVRDGRRGIDAVIDDLVFKKRLVDIAFVLSELAGVPESHVNNVLHKVNGMGIAVVCRSLDMSETTYGRLSRLRCDRLKLSHNQAEPMIREFLELDKATAERTLRFHKVRSNVAVRAS